MRLVINNDSDAESPLECSPWTLVSFNKKHFSYGDHVEYVDPRAGAGGSPRAQSGIREKISASTAFWLDYFEHGQCAWSFLGEGTQCRWDTSRCAGIILGDYLDLKNLSHGERRQDAKDMLDLYTSWCNGNVYEYSLVPELGCSHCNHIRLDWDDATWHSGWFDADEMFEDICTEVTNSGEKVTGISGDAASLVAHSHIKFDMSEVKTTKEKDRLIFKCKEIE